MLKILLRATGALMLVLILLLLGFRVAALRREDQVASRIAPVAGQFVDTRMGRYFVSSAGPAGGTPVLLVHGSGAWGGLWQDTATALGRRGYRAIAIDLPPFGFSDRPEDGDYSRPTQGERIVAIADALKLDHPLVVGHSFGAGPVMEAAMRNTERFGGIVIVDGALGIGAATSTIPLPLRSQVVRETLVAASVTNPLLTKVLLQQLLHRTDRALPRYVEILQRPLGRKGSTEAVAAWLPTLLASDGASKSMVAENYRRMEIPIALIWGDMDTITPTAQAEQLQRLLPKSSLINLPAVGHIPQVEDPKSFDDALFSALSSVAIAGDPGGRSGRSTL